MDEAGAEADHADGRLCDAGDDDVAPDDQLRPPALERLELERIDDVVGDDTAVRRAPAAQEDRCERRRVGVAGTLERQCFVPSSRTTTR